MTTDAERGAEFDRLYRVMFVATRPGGPGGVSLTSLVRYVFDEGVRVTPLLPVAQEAEEERQ